MPQVLAVCTSGRKGLLSGARPLTLDDSPPMRADGNEILRSRQYLHTVPWARLLLLPLGFFLTSLVHAQNLMIESIEPLVHYPQAAPTTLDVPKDVIVTFRASYPVRGHVPGTVHTFEWTGATEIVSTSMNSVARREFSKRGNYVIRVVGDGGTLDASITVNVGGASARSLKIEMVGPAAGSHEVGHIKTPWPCKARINRPEYQHLIEWRTSGKHPGVGRGPLYDPDFSTPARYELSVGPDPRQRATFDIYEVTHVTWDSPWGEAIWYGLPITFTATTFPPGFENFVTWNVDTMHDMSTRADPAAGVGPRFTTTFSPTVDDQFFWAQVYASNLGALPQTDLKPPASGPLGGNDGLESPSPECRSLDGSDPARHPVKNTGDVYLHSGEYYLEQVDLRIKGRGFDFEWRRKYRSREGRLTTMGWNWDFSYNLRVQVSTNPADRWVFSGDGRRDTYTPTTGGCWVAEGLFNQLCLQADDAYVLTLPNRTTWRFAPLDGSAVAGLVLAIFDRNQNTMTFGYDPAGRVTTIMDTLGHSILVAYTADGFISTVTGPAGRQVKYAYYQAADTQGSAGDLKSVTSPVVNGTPNGNDFPAGKTITFTYSKSPLPALSHRLLTLTDGLGQQLVRNVYTATTDTTRRDFNRIDRQIFPDGTIFYAYIAQTPGAANGEATTRTIIRDRALNVREAFFNARNQMVLYREYTGRAPDPGQPTTDISNRPIGKLRIGDPEYFQTSGICDADSLRTALTLPCDNQLLMVYEKNLNPGAPRLQQGNLREHHSLPGSRGGDQAEIVQRIEHLAGFGSCCGESFPTRQIDGRGHETTHMYDPAGNRLHTQYRLPEIVEDYEHNVHGQLTAHVFPDNGAAWRRRDVLVYATSGPGAGYLQERHTDALGRNLTTQYEHDEVGNVTRIIHPRGLDTLYSVNALDQVVRETSQEVSPGSGVRYQRDRFYDAADQVVRLDTQNADENGVTQANAAFSTTLSYDPLGRLTQRRQEVDTTHDVVETYTYDANGNLREARDGESVAGRQPANRSRNEVDERDKLYREISAPGDPRQSTTQYDYDCNGNVVRTLEGIENVPRISTYSYDGYDRLAATNDPMGNAEGYEYDANHNVLSMQVHGELTDAPGSAGNVRLYQVSHVYDDMDRPTRDDAAFFNPATQTPVGDGQSITLYEYNAASQVTRMTDDNGGVTQTAYDTTLERNQTIDAKGNTVAYTYDNNRNVIQMLETERSDDGGPDQQFLTTYEYDGLDRLSRSEDSSQNVVERKYDSRHNMTTFIDASRVSSGSPGNITTSIFDGLNRLISSSRVLTDTGNGSGVPVGTITMTQQHDDSSRLTQECDGNGNCTRYTYDALNRVGRTDYADGTFETREYDVHDNAIRIVDPNGSIIVSEYDQLDGLLQRTITPGPNVDSATTVETYTYDGLSQLIRAENDQSVVTRAYDSMSNVIQETANGLTLSVVYDGDGNPTQLTYPGGRVIQMTHDVLNRTLSVSDQGGAIASYAYVGPERVRRRDFGNGTRTIYGYDGIVGTPNPPNDHGVKQLVRLTASTIATGTALDDWSFTWDRMANRVQRDNLLVSAPAQTRRHQYDYDSAFRLKMTTVSDGALTVTSTTAYTLDAAGNRLIVTGIGGGNYSMDSTLPQPADAQVNQYTTTPLDTRGYDLNGNLTSTQTPSMTQPRGLSFDAFNRLVGVSDPTFGLNIRYVYDVFGRRLERREGEGTPTTTAKYSYFESQEVEETDATGATRATFTYGNGDEEILTMRRAGSDYYFHADDQGNVLALTDAAGAVVERYEYDDFGTPITTSAVGNPYLFAGRRYDADTGLYYFNARYLDPSAGRFISRDPLGTWGDSENLGNASVYAANNPWSRSDPTGQANIGCDAGTSAMLADRQDEAEGLARRSYDYLARRSGVTRLCDRRYRTWFGLPTASRWNNVERRFAEMRNRLAGDLTYDCTNTAHCQEKGIFGLFKPAAYVYGGCPSDICLCSKFFHGNTLLRAAAYYVEYTPLSLRLPGLPEKYQGGEERQAETLVHEVSHLEGTHDYAYSAPLCRGLAIINPSGAIHNADSYAFFSTSSESGSCLGLYKIARRIVRATREAAHGAVRFAERAGRRAAHEVRNAVRRAEDAAHRVAKKIRKRLRHRH